MSHCLEPITLECDDYNEFLRERAELIMEIVEALIRKSVVRVSENIEDYLNDDE